MRYDIYIYIHISIFIYIYLYFLHTEHIYISIFFTYRTCIYQQPHTCIYIPVNKCMHTEHTYKSDSPQARALSPRFFTYRTYIYQQPRTCIYIPVKNIHITVIALKRGPAHASLGIRVGV